MAPALCPHYLPFAYPALHLRSSLPSRPLPIASSNLPALRLSRPPTLLSSAYCALRPSRSALCLRLRLRLSARTPFAKLLAVLPSAHRVLQPSRSAHCLPPRPRLSARTPFARLLAVPPSVSFALRSFFCLARLFLFLTPSSIWMGISGEDFPRGQLFCIFPSAGFQHTLIYLIYIRSECRFRTPPGTVLFCRSDAAASLPVCLSACLLVRRTFHLNFFVCCIFLPTSRPTFLHLAASFVRPFSPVALPLLPFFTAHRALPPEFFPPATSFTAPPARPFSTLPHPSSALFRRSPLPNSGFSPLAPFPNSIFSSPAAPFFPPFPRKFAAPFGKVKALLRASPSELRIGPTPTSALPLLLLRPQSSRHRFYGQNASCRFTMQSQLRQKNIQKNL